MGYMGIRGEKTSEGLISKDSTVFLSTKRWLIALPVYKQHAITTMIKCISYDYLEIQTKLIFQLRLHKIMLCTSQNDVIYFTMKYLK